MVIDYNKCVRYARGDERFAVPLVPYRCPVCAKGVPFRSKDEEDEPIEATVSYLTEATFSGKLAPVDEPPRCEDHNKPVEMERV